MGEKSHNNSAPAAAGREPARVQYATFRLNGELCAVDVLRVQEILWMHEMTPVPLAPGYVRGLINLRGQIVTVIDLGKRLMDRTIEISAESMNLVVKADDNIACLLVDEIGDVLDVDDTAMEPVLPTLKTINREYVRGIHKLENEILIVLEADRLIDPD